MTHRNRNQVNFRLFGNFWCHRHAFVAWKWVRYSSAPFITRRLHTIWRYIDQKSVRGKVNREESVSWWSTFLPPWFFLLSSTSLKFLCDSPTHIKHVERSIVSVHLSGIFRFSLSQFLPFRPHLMFALFCYRREKQQAKKEWMNVGILLFNFHRFYFSVVAALNTIFPSFLQRYFKLLFFFDFLWFSIKRKFPYLWLTFVYISQKKKSFLLVRLTHTPNRTEGEKKICSNFIVFVETLSS